MGLKCSLTYKEESPFPAMALLCIAFLLQINNVLKNTCF